MKFWSAQEAVDELFLQNYNDGLILLCGLDSAFASALIKGLMMLTTGSTCLKFSLTSYLKSVLETYSIKLVLILLPLEAVLSAEFHLSPLYLRPI